MPDFRRGAEHITKANEAAQSNGGSFKPFLPNIYWKDQDESYLLFLNALDEIPMVKLQKVWTSEGRGEMVIARTDEAIGASKDPMEEEWGYPATDMNVAIAVELDATFDVVKGRKRPSGFTVKTRTFERKVFENDKDTGRKEEVTVPVIGLIAQSPNNFFNHVASQDANVAPINETAAGVRRLGAGTDTEYEVALFADKSVDLSNLLEYIHNVNWLGDDIDIILTEIEGLESDEEAATIIGSVMLDRRLDEMADQENYDEVFALITEPARYPKKGWKKSGSTEEKAAPQRTERRSQRRANRTEAPVEETPAEAVSEPDDAPEETVVEETPKAPRRSRRASAPKEETSKSSPVRERMAELQRKADAKAAELAARES